MTSVEMLRVSGLKATLPRVNVLEAMRHGPSRHLSAEDVYRRLLETQDELPLRMVYRALFDLEHARLVSRARLSSARAEFELNDDTRHDHPICLEMRRSGEVKLNSATSPVGTRYRYFVTHTKWCSI